jgi:hypothetical protein
MGEGETYARNTEILNRWDFVSCSSKDLISTQLASKCSIMFFPAKYAPRRSSSRSLSGLR